MWKSLLLGAMLTSAAIGAMASQTVQLVNLYGQCLDVGERGGDIGGSPFLARCEAGKASQRFRTDGDVLRVADRCLDVRGWAGKEGADVIVASCSFGTSSQRWQRGTADGYVHNQFAGLCLELGRQAGPARLARCGGGASQSWSWQPVK